MSPPDGVKRTSYHHGNLQPALVRAGIDLAREGGPEAVVLREAARRVGVSATAAYRHFGSLDDLVAAVGHHARAELAEAMSAEVARCPLVGRPGVDAVARLKAVARGYIRFGLAEPGLFAVAFVRRPHTGSSAERGGPAPHSRSSAVLFEALQAARAADLLVDEPEVAFFNAWAGVHGLTFLLLGPRAHLDGAERDAFVEQSLDFVIRGLTRTRRLSTSAS